MLRSLLQRKNRKEAGQALPLFGLMIMILLGFTAMSVDVGRYVWARTSMQAGVDAAAIAAAQDMPNQVQAEATAADYWIDNSGFIQSQGTNVNFAVTYPPGNKRIRVSGEADIPTWFAKFFGVPNWHVTAEGDAEAQVLDIAVVLDISGSMCYDPPGIIHTESTESVLMSPGHPASGSVPTVATAISGSTGASIVITLSSNAIFNSTSSATNNTNFGYSSTNRYPNQTISGRNGIIAIFANGASGPYELFDISAIGPGANQLTVTRAQTNNWTSTATPQMAHAVGAEVWANRSGCDKVARFTTPGNYGLYPFDGTIAAAEYFTTLFNASYDKIGVARYSTNSASSSALSSNLVGVKNAINAFAPPAGSTNIAGGLAGGRLILDGAGKRANAVRVLVLLTDGIANTVCGADDTYGTGDYNNLPCSSTNSAPTGTAESHAYSEAVRATNADIIIFTIGLGNDVNASFLQRLADGGTAGVGPCQEGEAGCRYYFAPTPAQLDDAFQAIAEQTHIALVR